MTGDIAAERAVAAELAALPAGWTVLDRLVVGPPGVFVVEPVHWPGAVTAHDGELRHDGESRHAVVRDAQQAAEDVRRLLPSLDPRLVQPVLCFAGPTPGRARIAGVVVCTASVVVTELRSFPDALGPAGVAALVAQLRAGRPAGAGTGRAAVAPPARHRAGGRLRIVAPLVIGLVGVGLVAVAAVAGPGLLGGDDEPARPGQGTHQRHERPPHTP